MPMRSIESVKQLAGKRVLVRVDYNVPIEKGKVLESARLEATIPTIEFLKRNGAITVLLTHIGRPGGKKIPSLSTKPLAKELWKLLGSEVVYINDLVGAKAKKAIERARPGDVLLLENMRFSPDEEKNDGAFAMKLAELGDIFVQEGFAVAHRANASTAGIAAHIESFAGILLEKEISGLSKVIHKPKKPFCLVLGGAKIETKIPVIEHLLPKVSQILLGGGLVNTCLLAQGYDVGGSLVDHDSLEQAKIYANHNKIILPVDLIVGEFDGRTYRVVDIEDQNTPLCGPKEGIYDIGPKTIQLYAKYIKKAQTLVWNGAMGYFEQKPYDVATRSIALALASRSKGAAYGVIGGGETIQVAASYNIMDHIDLVSTGGGAMLEFLSGKELPGIVAIGG